MIGTSALGSTAIASGSSSQLAFTTLIESPDNPVQYLVEITVFDAETANFAGVTFTGDGVVSEIMPGDASVLRGGSPNLSNLTYADKVWVGSPTDTDKPNAYYEARVQSPLLIERRIAVQPEEKRRIERQVGNIEFMNGDGEFDNFIADNAVDGRRVRVLIGPEGGEYSDFTEIADVLGRTWTPRGLTAELSLRSRSFPLQQPIQNQLYGGGGGIEGGVELEDKPKPICLGKVRNTTPVLIDPANLIFQFHFRAAQAVDAVYDRGLALTDSGVDVSGYNNLVAQNVTDGEFVTALDVGLFKIGFIAGRGQITCDARGDADGGYIDTINDITIRILKDFGGINADDIDTVSFDGLNQTSDTIGYYIDETQRPSTQAVLNALIGGVNGFWGANRDGDIRAGELVDPAGETTIIDLDEFNVVSVEPEEPPLPRWRQRVSYQPNWTVQTSDLAANVSDARRQFLAGANRVAASADTSIRIRHVRAIDPPPLQSYFDTESAAQTLADRVLGLFKADRQFFRIVVRRESLNLDLGDVISLDWPRYGLSGGKNCIVVGLREDLSRNEGIIRVWS